LFRKVAIVGVGLLGGSLGLALRQRGLAPQVHGYVRRAASVPECLHTGAADAAGTELAPVVQDADLVVFCTPIGQMGGLAERMAPALKPGALVTDVGSVKAPVVAELEEVCQAAGGCFVGSHPMAGSEQTGMAAARADLFDGSVCVVTPTPRSDMAALGQIEQLWVALGARVMRLSPAQHDAVVAHASHLPQAVAAALAGWVLDPEAAPEQAQLCAGGFRDTTRIASGSPDMWRDILVANRRPVGQALDGFIAELGKLRQAVAGGDAAQIEAFLRTAKQRRDAWLGTRPVRRSAG
jgi:prephenate dehydrogenase